MAATDQQYPQGATDFRTGYQAESETNQSEYSSVSQTNASKIKISRRQSTKSLAQDSAMPTRSNIRGTSEYNTNINNDSSNKKLKRNINFDNNASSGAN